VVIFKDFFLGGLRFPLDPAVVDIFVRYGVFLHHMTPNSFARISIFMWLSKTCRLTPTPDNFARVMRVHYQPKTIFLRGSNGKSTEMEPQYGCYTFVFQQTAPSLMGVSKNKWPGDWSSFWFYHKVPLDPETAPSSGCPEAWKFGRHPKSGRGPHPCQRSVPGHPSRGVKSAKHARHHGGVRRMQLFPREGKLDRVILGPVGEGSLQASNAQLQRSLRTSERM